MQAHNVTHLGGVLFDANQFRGLLNGAGSLEQDLLATLLEGEEQDEQQGSRSLSSGDDGGTVVAAPDGGARAGTSQPRHQTAAAAGAAAGGSTKKRKKQQTGISAAQVNALEKQYLQKLELFKQLSAAQQVLKDKAWVLDAVLQAHEELAVRLQHLQAWEEAHQKQQQPPSGFEDPFGLLGISLPEVRAANSQKVLDMLRTTQQAMAKELLKYEMSGPDDAHRTVHPELQRLGTGIIQACKYIGIVRPDLVLFNSMHVDSVLTDDSSFADTVDAMPQAPPDHWRKVAEAGRLSSQALTRCHILSTLAEGWLERIQVERRVLTAALSNTVASAGTQRYVNQNGSTTAANGVQRTSHTGGGGAGVPVAPHPAELAGSARAATGASVQQQRLAALAQLASEGNGKSGEAAIALLMGVSDSGAGGAPVAGLPQDLPPEETIVARLQTNVDKERNVVLLVGELLWTRIFSIVECSRIFVHSHPWVVDDLCILHELSKLHLERT